jgi:NAD-dependent SIR2 family protein deacetylase
MNDKDISEMAGLFGRSGKITVFTGAGISVNSGIPDFRSSNGLYSFVGEKYDLPFPEAIFEISYFKKNPAPFFDLSRDLVAGDIKPTLAHKFIAHLEEKNKLNLVMTQNIDMLHQKAGNKKVIECHGTYETAHCLDCGKKYGLNDIKSNLERGSVPYCDCKGVIKPDIVFFGEQLPGSFFDCLYNPPETDLFLALGSSLTVMPAASFAVQLARSTTSVIVNLSETDSDGYFTHVFHEDIDEFCSNIWNGLGK